MGWMMVVMVAACVSAGGALAIDMDTLVADPTNVNVLRQYYQPMELRKLDGMNNVTQVFSSGFSRRGAGDAGMWNDEVNPLRVANTPVTHTWLFPDARVVGSWRMITASGRNPNSFVLEYLVEPGTDNWQTWSSQTFVSGTGGTSNFTEDAVKAYGIRYTATNTDAESDNRAFELNALQVFLASADSAAAKGLTPTSVRYTDGYSILTQPGVVNRSWASSNSGPWKAPTTSTSISSMYNGNPASAGELKNNYNEGLEGFRENRAYFVIEMNEETPMTSFSLGFTKEHGWAGNWEVYTIDVPVVMGGSNDPATALGSSIADITNLGWTLQYAFGYGEYSNGQPIRLGCGVMPNPRFGEPGEPEFFNSGDGTSADFLMTNPGFWQAVLVVWDAQTSNSNALKQFELYGSAVMIPVPEPATMTLLVLGGLAILRRRLV